MCEGDGIVTDCDNISLLVPKGRRKEKEKGTTDAHEEMRRCGEAPHYRGTMEC